MKAKIEKLILDIRGKKIELNLDEAKELKSALSEIFGADKVVEHVYHDRYVYPWRPYYGTLWGGQIISSTGQSTAYQMSLTGGVNAQAT